MDETRVLSPPVKTRLVVAGNLHPDLEGGTYYVTPGTTVREFMAEWGIEEFVAPTMCAMGEDDDNWVLREEWDSRVIEHNTLLVDARILAPYGGGGGGGSNPGLILGAIFLMVVAPYLGALAGTQAGIAVGTSLAPAAIASGSGAAAAAAATTAAGITKSLVTGLVLVGGMYGLQKIFSPKTRRPEEPSSTYSLGTIGNVARRRSPMPVLHGRVRIVPDLIEEPFTEYDGQKLFQKIDGNDRGRMGRAVQYVNEVFYISQGYVDKASLTAYIGKRSLIGLGEADVEILHPGEEITLVPIAVDTVDTGNVALNAPNEYQLISTTDEANTNIEDNDRGQIYPRAQISELVIDDVTSTTVGADTQDTAAKQGVNGADAQKIFFTSASTPDTSGINPISSIADNHFAGYTLWVGDIRDNATDREGTSVGLETGCGGQDPNSSNTSEADRNTGTKQTGKTDYWISGGDRTFPMSGDSWFAENPSTGRRFTDPYVSEISWRLFHPSRRRHIVSSGWDSGSGRLWVKVSPPFDSTNYPPSIDLRWGQTGAPGPGNSRCHIRKDWTAPLRMERETGKAQAVHLDFTGGLLIGRSDGGNVFRWGVGLHIQVRSINPTTGWPTSDWKDVKRTWTQWARKNDSIVSYNGNGKPQFSPASRGYFFNAESRGAQKSHFATHPIWGPADEVNPLGITVSFDMKKVPVNPYEKLEYDAFSGLPGSGFQFSDAQFVEVRVMRTTPTGVDPYNRDFNERPEVTDDRIIWTGLRFEVTDIGSGKRSYNHGTVVAARIRASANLNTNTAREVAFESHRLLPTYGQAVGVSSAESLPADPVKTINGSTRIVLAFPDHNMAVGQKFVLSGLTNLADETGATGTISLNGTNYTVTDIPSKDSIAFNMATEAEYTENTDVQTAHPTWDVGPDAGGSSGGIRSVSPDGSTQGVAHNPGYKTTGGAAINPLTHDYSDVDPQYFSKTDSGVWHALDMLRDPFYGAGIADTDIDLDTWAHYASIHGGKSLTPSGGGTATAMEPDSHGYYHDQRGGWIDVVGQTLRVHRLKLLNSFGKWTLVRDEAQTLPVAGYSSRNILKDSLQVSYSVSRTDLPKWVQVEFFNKNTWNMDTVDGYLDDQNASEPNIEVIRMPGIQSRDHAWREARYLTADHRYRRTQVKFSTEYEGLLPLPTQVITVNHPIPGWGQAGDVIAYDDNGGSGPFILTTDQILDWRGAAIDHNGAFDSATDVAEWVAVGPGTSISLYTADAHLGDGCVQLTKSSTNTAFGIEQVNIPITAGPLTAAEGAGLYFVAYAKAANAQTAGKKVRYKLNPDGTGNNAVTGGYATLSEDYWTPLEITYDITGGNVTQIDSLVVEMDPTDVANGDVFLLDSSTGWPLGGEHTVAFKGDEGAPLPEPGLTAIRVQGDNSKIQISAAFSVSGVTLNTDGDGFDRTQFMFGKTTEFRKKCVVMGIDPRGFDTVDVDSLVDDDRVHTVDGQGTLPPTDVQVLESTPDAPSMTAVTAAIYGDTGWRDLQVTWASVNGAEAYDIEWSQSIFDSYEVQAKGITGSVTFTDGDELRCLPPLETFSGYNPSWEGEIYVTALGAGFNTVVMVWATGTHDFQTGDWVWFQDLPLLDGWTKADYEGVFQVTAQSSTEIRWEAASVGPASAVGFRPASDARFSKATAFVGYVDLGQTAALNVTDEFRYIHAETYLTSNSNRNVGPRPQTGDSLIDIQSVTSIADSTTPKMVTLVDDPESILSWSSGGDGVTGTSKRFPIAFDEPQTTGRLDSASTESGEIIRVRMRAIGRLRGEWFNIVARGSFSRLAGPVNTLITPPTAGLYDENIAQDQYVPLLGDKLYGHILPVEVDKETANVENFSQVGLQQAICREVAITSANYNTFIQFTDLPVGVIITSVDVYTNVKNANVVATGDYRLLVGFVGDEDAYAVIVDPLFTQGAMATINMNSIAGLNGSVSLQGKGDSMGVFDSTARTCGVELRGTGTAPSGAGQIMTITIHYHNAGQAI